MSCEEARDLLAAYSVDALDTDERDAVDDHLARCRACAAELRDLLEAAGRLALALPQADLPPGAKARLLARVGGSRHAARTSWGDRLGLRVPRVSMAGLVAGAALVVALGTSLWAAGLQVQLNEQRALVASLREPAARYERIVAVLQSPDMQIRAMQGSELAPSAMGRVYVDPDTGAGMMMVRSLPRLAEGRAYQLWCIRPNGTRESGGLLKYTDANGNGYTLINCPGPLTTWQGFGITEEPAAGSPAPTGQRLLGGTV